MLRLEEGTDKQDRHRSQINPFEKYISLYMSVWVFFLFGSTTFSIRLLTVDGSLADRVKKVFTHFPVHVSPSHSYLASPVLIGCCWPCSAPPISQVSQVFDWFDVLGILRVRTTHGISFPTVHTLQSATCPLDSFFKIFFRHGCRSGLLHCSLRLFITAECFLFLW